MKKFTAVTAIAFLSVFLIAGNTFALNLGSNITIFDENIGSGDWHGSDEDQEVEPGMEHGQKWDLEGFFLDGDNLSIVGG